MVNKQRCFDELPIPDAVIERVEHLAGNSGVSHDLVFTNRNQVLFNWPDEAFTELDTTPMVIYPDIPTDMPGVQLQRDHTAVTGIQGPSVKEAETVGCWDVELETAVVINCWANVETICCVGSPGSVSGQIVLNQCFRAKQRKRHFAEGSWLAEILGLHWAKHKRLSMSSTCSRFTSQSWRGQNISTVAKAATKFSLKVLMACLAALT